MLVKALKDANLRGAVSMCLDRILSKPELYGILDEVMAAKDAKELVASEAKWIGALAAQKHECTERTVAASRPLAPACAKVETSTRSLPCTKSQYPLR